MFIHQTLFLFLVLFSFEQVDHPVIDGKFSTVEWALAKSYPLKNGGTLYVLNDTNALYIAFKGTAPGWTHVYLQHQDTLRILHASAALGTGKYVRRNNQWYNTSQFQWDIRDRVLSAEVQNKMNAFYKVNGWVANNNNMADKIVFEYKIDARLFDKESKMAFVYAVDKDHPLFFPHGLTDQTIHPDILYGTLAEQLTFDLKGWALVKDL